MRREVFEGREGFMNVGEAPGVTPARNEHITDPKNGELDMLFLFDHVGVDQAVSKWDVVPFEVRNLRARMADQQAAVKTPAGPACSSATTISHASCPAGATTPTVNHAN